ncbi:glycosyltransferase family 4 protein [Pokkaliibacter sp. CJK22405]|uniref:glycosyltransferase family 4 protein n=1 Tax=Pokkaliibacter sp. CJK22405 TaxID=3384615 RepID=UPI003984C92D
MLPIAFYAPLKAPDHPNPSGDRALARLFCQALTLAGFEVHLASRLRSRDGKGDEGYQRRLKSVAEKLADRLVRRYQRLPAQLRPRLWFTYHHYHKAPDWIGPRVAQALGIPYVIAEGSWSERKAHGPWHFNWSHSLDALRAAQALFCLNPKDQQGLSTVLGEQAPLVALPPFMDLASLPAAEALPTKAKLAAQQGITSERPWLISVAMMRPGDKLASFTLLGKALAQLTAPFELIVIGDGQARPEVEATLAGLPVHYLGQQPPEQVYTWLAAADLFVWPAVNEAFGMALLEAQAMGTAVLAGEEGGVANVVATPASLLTPRRDADALARQLETLLLADDWAAQLAQRGQHAREQMAKRHSLTAASQQLANTLRPLLETH